MISLILFVILLVITGSLFNKLIIEIIPVGFCAMILIMYFLAFFRLLGVLELILVGILLIGLIIVKRNGIGIQEVIKWIKWQFKMPGTYCFLCLFTILTIALWHRQVLEYDDYKYWASAVKSLLARGGYETVNHLFIASYGDYPQGLPLILWWFEHILGTWHENMLYIGYMYFAMSFLLPMTRKISIENKILQTCFCIGISILLYAISTSYTRFGISLEPDRVMALIYAGALLSVATDENNDCFSRIRLSLYMIAIILMKSIGFVWALFAFSFYIIWKKVRNIKINLFDMLVILGPIVILASWNIYCVFTNRSAYLTENMFEALLREKNWVSIIRSRFFIVQTFLENFITLELNCVSTVSNTTFGINLSSMGFLIVYIFLIIFIARKNLCNGKEVKAITMFVFVTGIIYHIILLWSYLFMFYDEFTISNRYHMQNLTSHYAGPFYIGSLLLLLEIIFNKDNFYEDLPEDCNVEGKSNKRYTRYMIFLMIMLLLPNYSLTYQFLLGYRKQEIVEKNMNARLYYTNVLTPFMERIILIPDSLNERVFFMTTTVDGRLRSYLHYFTTPLSVFDIYRDEISIEDLKEQITISESKYFFVMDSYDSTEKEKLKEWGGIDTDTLYEISWEDDKLYFTIFAE